MTGYGPVSRPLLAADYIRAQARIDAAAPDVARAVHAYVDRLRAEVTALRQQTYLLAMDALDRQGSDA